MEMKGDIRWSADDPCKAKLTVINYSAGKQSTCLLWMVLRGELKPDTKDIIVLNADPGIENTESYRHVRVMKNVCDSQGIEFETVDGPNLFQDLVQLKNSGRTRVDNPAYFTKNENGKRGMLRQKCTYYYKIAPMDRALRRIMHARFGIGLQSKRIPQGFVEKWLGFTADEVTRIKPPAQRYVTFRYPLVELGMTKADVETWMADRNLELPPRSVCNACFANGLDTLKDMYENRYNDWAQAVAVDEAVRDLSYIGIREPVYVNDTLLPLTELAKRGFDLGKDQDEYSCDSGYCFI